MIEEAHVPECVSVLARMTRRRLLLATHAGYSPSRPFPSWRNRVAEFLPAASAESAVVDRPVAAASDEPAPAVAVEEYDSLAIPKLWAERARAELERLQSAEVADRIAEASRQKRQAANRGREDDGIPVDLNVREALEGTAALSDPLAAIEASATFSSMPAVAVGVETPVSEDAGNLTWPGEAATVPSEIQGDFTGAPPPSVATDVEELAGDAAGDLRSVDPIAGDEPATFATSSGPRLASEAAKQVLLLPSISRAMSAEGVSTTTVPSESPLLVFGRIEESQLADASDATPACAPEVESATRAVARSTIVPVFVIHPPVDTTSPLDGGAPEFAPAELSDYNRIGLDYRRPMPRPKVHGFVVDFHCRLLSARHAPAWFEAADHYGIDCFVTMTPLEEAGALQREWGGRLQFIAVPAGAEEAAAMSAGQWVDDFLVRLEAFYNLGSRIVKFHAAPGTLAERGIGLGSPLYKPVFREIVDRKMGVMTDFGDPDPWYRGKYGATPESAAKYGTRDEHYRMWEGLLQEYPGVPWVGAHLGGNPEDLPRLQRLLDRFPDLWLDNSATRWMAREVSRRREAAREFFLRNRARLLFGTGQVSGEERGFDFLASRFWAHRKLWETAYAGPSPIADPELPPAEQPALRGLALPDSALQSLYHDNAVQYLAKVGAVFGGWG